MIRHALRFGLVGCLTTGLSIGLFLILMRLGAHYLAASTLAWAAGLSVSFVLNKRFTFDLRTPTTIGEAAAFAGGYVLQLVLSWIGYAVLIDGLTVEPARAAVLVTAAVAVFSFLFMRQAVFRRGLRSG